MNDPSTVTSPGKKVSKGARTKGLIKDAVLVLHARNPWSSITLNDICEATGLTAGAFYYHFESKDKVGEEIAISFLVDSYGRVVEEISGVTNLFDVFYKTIAAFYQNYVRNPHLCHLAYLVLKSQEGVFDAWTEARKPLLLRLQGAVRDAREELNIVDGTEEFVARWLLGNVEDFVWNVFMSRGNHDLYSVASGPDVFIRQQAILWYRVALSQDPSHPLARLSRRSKTRAGPRAP